LLSSVAQGRVDFDVIGIAQVQGDEVLAHVSSRLVEVVDDEARQWPGFGAQP
jgi:hypothetical protein